MNWVCRGVLQFDRLTALSEAEEQYAPTIFYERKKEGGPQYRSCLEGIITWMLQSAAFFTSLVFNFYITVRLKETISVVVRR